MQTTPRRLLCAVALTATIALLALSVASVFVPLHVSWVSWLVAAELGAGLILAEYFRVQVAARAVSTVSGTARLLSAVLLPLQAMMLASAGARLFAGRRRRERQLVNIFNASMHALQVGAGGLVFRAVSGGWTLSDQRADRGLAGVAAAGVTMYVVNLLLVHGIMSVQLGRWRAGALRSMALSTIHVEAGLLALALIGAVVATAAPWAVGLPVALTVVLYRVLLAEAQHRGEQPRPAVQTPVAGAAFSLGTWVV